MKLYMPHMYMITYDGCVRPFYCTYMIKYVLICSEHTVLYIGMIAKKKIIRCNNLKVGC